MSEIANKEILEARKKFAEKFANTQIGGKGTQRRKKEPKHRGTKVEVDKKIQALAKKSGARKINEVSEINIFKDDNSVMHFKKPTLEYSFKEKVSFVSGTHEKKTVKELLPGILKQLGSKQLEVMKEYAESLKAKDKKKNQKIEEAPELVEDFEEVSKETKKEENTEKKEEQVENKEEKKS